jgi:hypothetical protein
MPKISKAKLNETYSRFAVASLFGFNTKKDFFQFIKDNQIDYSKMKADRLTRQLKKAIRKARKAQKNVKQEYNVALLLYKEIENKPFYWGKGNRYIKRVVGNKTEYFEQIRYFTAHVQNKDIIDFNTKRVFQLDPNGKYNLNWKALIDILSNDNDFKTMYASVAQSMNVNCIIVKQVSTLEIAEPIDPLDKPLFAGFTNEFINSKFTSTDINEKANKFSELFCGKSINVEPKDWMEEKLEIIQRGELPKDEKKGSHLKNSCFVRLILETYHDQFNKLDSKGRRRFKELTLTGLLKTLKIFDTDNNEINGDLGLTIKESVKFFEQYKLGLDVYDIFESCIFSYRPEKLNKNIFPSVMRILVHNGHAFKITENIETLEKITKRKLMNMKHEINVSSNYNVIKFDDEKDCVFVNNLEDITKTIKEAEKDTILLCNSNMEFYLFELLKSKYCPTVSFHGGLITNIFMNVKKLKFNLKDVSTWGENEAQIYSIENTNLYQRYKEQYEKLYSECIRDEFKSYYHPSTLKINNMMSMKPLSGFCTKTLPTGKFDAIDMRKAYTDCVKRIKKVPVFGYFDIYKKYDGHKIEDETMYIVKCESKQMKDVILFPTLFSRCFGYKLNRIDGVPYEIIGFIKPHKVLKCNFSDAIDNLFSTTIDEKNEKNNETLQKYISNVITGLFEKKMNKRSVSHMFTDYGDAVYYQLKYGGKIYIIEEDKKQVYILNLSASKELQNGFIYIKELIYEIQKLKVYQLYNECINKKLDVVGIKTDAILINRRSDLCVLFDYSNRIGGLKLEHDKIVVDSKIEKEMNEFDESLFNVPYECVEINNEFDKNEINQVFERNRKTMIKGLYAGVGKTTSVKNYGHNTLFISPYNKLCQNLRKDGFDAITLNKLLGVYVDGNSYAKKCDYDITDYDSICFDEIMLYSPKELRLINEFMMKNDKIKFFATGDTDQLKPFGHGINNVSDISKYMNDCIRLMFDCEIMLKVNKRLKSEEDRQKLINLKNDIFNTKISIEKLCKKYGINTVKDLDDVTTNQNITYFNYYTDMVNSFCHKKVKAPQDHVMIKGVKYWKSLNVICKKHYQVKAVKTFVNYIYEIIGFNKNSITVRDPLDRTIIELSHKLFSEHFRLSYSNTCHSCQGLSIDDKITIFNSNLEAYVQRDFLYVAITRATKLENVTVFIHDNETVVRQLEGKLNKYFTYKVSEYQRQDAEKKRNYEKNEYVDLEWIREKYKACKVCSYCRTPFDIGINDNGYVSSTLTLDRMNSDLPHVKSNCVLSCIECNITRKSKPSY